jgi:hypothetical protein
MSLNGAFKLILTLKCEQSTGLMSESLDRELTRCERLAVKLHALCCRSCRRFGRHVAVMRDAIRSRIEADLSALPSASLTPEQRRRIQGTLSEAEGKDP